MIRILYFSTARADISRAEVNAIVEHARGANRERGVTGALAFNGRNFCQVLEGPEEIVRDLVAKISLDERHSGFKIIDEKPIDTQHFSSWSMEMVDDLDFSRVINAMAA